MADAVDLHNLTGSGGLFTLAALPDLAAVSAAVDTTVPGFKLNGCCELLTPAGRPVSSLTLPSYKFIKFEFNSNFSGRSSNLEKKRI